MRYSEGFKNRMIERMAGPEGIAAIDLAREVNVHQTTLSRWVKERSFAAMTTDKSPSRSSRPAQEKLRIVLEAERLDEAALGELLRREGIHQSDLDEWRSSMLTALGPAKRKSTKKSPEAKKIAHLERDLDRKNRALAEVTALLALKKKAEEFWGDGDDDMSERRDS